LPFHGWSENRELAYLFENRRTGEQKTRLWEEVAVLPLPPFTPPFSFRYFFLLLPFPFTSFFPLFGSIFPVARKQRNKRFCMVEPDGEANPTFSCGLLRKSPKDSHKVPTSAQARQRRREWERKKDRQLEMGWWGDGSNTKYLLPSPKSERKCCSISS